MHSGARSLQIYRPDDDQVQHAREWLRRQAPYSFTFLFSDPLWGHIEWVALAWEQGQLVGMASLAPWDADGEGGPKIVGAWVESDHRKQGIGTALVTCLVLVAQQHYNAIPCCVVISYNGRAFVQTWAAKNLSVDFQIMPEEELIDLPD